MTASEAPQETRQGAMARAWLAMAVGSLVLAGAFAALLVVGRLPGIASHLADPGLFRRLLVVHVDLSLVVWFYAFAAALFSLLPTTDLSPRRGQLGLWLGATGVVLLVMGAGIGGAEPVLSNYVPVVDHGVFLAGLIAFFCGVALTVSGPGLAIAREAGGGVLPAASFPFLRAFAVAVLVAGLTFATAVVVTPRDLPAIAYFELVMWGGGHVLQAASVAAMLASWILLVTAATGEAPLSRRASGVLAGVLVAPLLAAPLLASRGTTHGDYLRSFTLLMEFGIAPVVLIVLGLCARAIAVARRTGRASMGDPRLVGFVASAALTLVGFALGATISGSTTLVPGHYHASIGAVTVAFMATAYQLATPLGLSLGSRARRLARWQPLAFGVGQTIFALGFAVAGAYGALRKTYAAEQAVTTFGQRLGLVVMGIGGAVAVAAGLVFLWLMVSAWRRRVPLSVSWQTWAARPGETP